MKLTQRQSYYGHIGQYFVNVRWIEKKITYHPNNYRPKRKSLHIVAVNDTKNFDLPVNPVFLEATGLARIWK